MKLIIIIALFFSNSVFAQNKTFTSAGKTYEIMEFSKMYTIDSSLIIEKNNKGWSIPDTAQLRSIHSQWFGTNHVHPYYPYKSSPNHAEFKQDIEGLKFLSSTKYEGDNYIQVDMYNPIKMFLAPSENINSAAYYSLVLIKEK
jgi:hypothetical protein